MAAKPPRKIPPDMDPWERLPNESTLMYSRFRSFLELGRTRTLKQAAELLHGLGDKISYRVLQQYGYEYRWTERAEAHDYDQDRLQRERILRLRQEMMERHRRLASGVMAKAVAGLQNLQPTDLSALDVVRMAKFASELERSALGEPERTIAVTGQGGGPVVVDDLSRLTAQERRARREQIAMELMRRAAARDDEDDD